eukprot:TRINITY_DN79947_c0_g1_i1.p1 TRINITY_DN79947_c0_g1~~TRINITY_DN79947_c0_g1_i1.p1  ORF type:complete len:339 (+),score=59.21 TRINITY_DN79947_c0_g1_i1:40-1017(+)
MPCSKTGQQRPRHLKFLPLMVLSAILLHWATSDVFCRLGGRVPKFATQRAAGDEKLEQGPARPSEVATRPEGVTDRVIQRRTATQMLSLRPFTMLLALTLFVPAVRTTDPYRWTIAQVETMDAAAEPDAEEVVLLQKAGAIALKAAGGRDMTIVDLGCGTGGDFSFLKAAAIPKPLQIFAVEPNTFCWSSAKTQADLVGWASSVSFVEDVSSLATGSSSLVLCRRVLCSAADPSALVADIFRVLRPGGVFVFIEHVAAREGSFLRTAQEVLKPLQMAFANNCDPARETAKVIRGAAAWDRFEAEVYALDMAGPLTPHIRGFVVKP